MPEKCVKDFLSFAKKNLKFAKKILTRETDGKKSLYMWSKYPNSLREKTKHLELSVTFWLNSKNI